MCRHFINKCGACSSACNMSCHVMAARNLGGLISGWCCCCCCWCCHYQMWSVVRCGECYLYCCLSAVAARSNRTTSSCIICRVAGSLLCVIAIKVFVAACLWLQTECHRTRLKSVLIICKTLPIKSFVPHPNRGTAICSLSAVSIHFLAPRTSHLWRQSFINTP